jgi:hypothetical protein
MAQDGLDVNKWLEARLGKRVDVLAQHEGVLFTIVGTLERATVDVSTGEPLSETDFVTEPSAGQVNVIAGHHRRQYRVGDTFLVIPRDLRAAFGPRDSVIVGQGEGSIIIKDPEDEE